MKSRHQFSWWAIPSASVVAMVTRRSAFEPLCETTIVVVVLRVVVVRVVCWWRRWWTTLVVVVAAALVVVSQMTQTKHHDISFD